MAYSLKHYIVTFILASLFIISITSFMTTTRENYNLDPDVIDDSQIDLTNLQDKVNKTSSDAENWQEAFTSDNFFVSLGSIVLFSIWGIFKLMWTSITSFAGIYLDGMYNVFGIDPMITGSLTALLIIGLIFAVWRAVKTGE